MLGQVMENPIPCNDLRNVTVCQLPLLSFVAKGISMDAMELAMTPNGKSHRQPNLFTSLEAGNIRTREPIESAAKTLALILESHLSLGQFTNTKTVHRNWGGYIWESAYVHSSLLLKS